MQQGLPRRRRPRPLPDAPIDRLLARSSELAGGWLIALVEDLPLEETPRIHLSDLAAEGPALCDAVVRAIADDDELQLLAAGGAGERLAARAGQIAGAGAPETISGAVDCLRGVIWSALRESFADPSPDQLFDLGERLALVGELVRAAALRAWAGSGELSVARREVAERGGGDRLEDARTQTVRPGAARPGAARGGAGRGEAARGEEWDEAAWEQRLSDWVARAKEQELGPGPAGRGARGRRPYAGHRRA